MDEYFPDIVAILEKRKTERAPLRGAGVLFCNTGPPPTELSKMLERGGDGEGGCYERGPGPGGNGQRVGGGNGGGGEGRTSTSHTTQADSNQRVKGSPSPPFPPEQKEEETEETDPQALTDASRKGDLLKVKHIIEGARGKLNLDWQDKIGKTALSLASENGHTDIVRLLVDAKANVDMEDKTSKKTALIWASENGHTDIVRLLVDAKANVDMQNKNSKKTALLWASDNGHTDIVRLLVDAKANVDMQDQSGKTALMCASLAGHTDVVRLLVDAKASVDMQDKKGNSVLMLAIQKENVEMVEYLLARPGSATQTVANIPDPQGRTPLFRAAAGGHIFLVELLLRRGADPSLKDASGNTALAVAEEAGKMQVVERLKS
uniref:Uncharacterized protein n=1 Tax=Chromera velia CCMP2878 TaxID=1169474 RepID=A0A0G4HYK4_9ALVE|eukprot:Cvel_1535.t1-p1 / transcript=Cvel_1535.t1 / gene=Cvel_1535 / organism=Chromera_velia_CCMP2878 / gene_product=Putative ankyrin repeat protein MM_0045, putative / transcript_product=Putative ankyrin repeat protein MM_0045, putative / location=Cvel_scaffold54:55897-57681(-) / protein_length=376 / sequence_SO=supercontig / SO=protein_coding / is_pseudo=false